MGPLGIGGMPAYTSTNVGAIKKAIETQEMSMAKLLESASSQGATANLQTPAAGVQELVAETTQRGGGLDISA